MMPASQQFKYFEGVASGGGGAGEEKPKYNFAKKLGGTAGVQNPSVRV